MEHTVAKSVDDIHDTFTVPCKERETDPFTSSIIK